MYQEHFQYRGIQYERGKTYVAGALLAEPSESANPTTVGIPFLGIVCEQRDDLAPLFHPYYSQLEIAAGLLGDVRVGVNAGEFVDFLLGWACIDIFSDDIAGRENEKKSNKGLHENGDKPPSGEP